MPPQGVKVSKNQRAGARMKPRKRYCEAGAEIVPVKYAPVVGSAKMMDHCDCHGLRPAPRFQS